MKLVAALGVFFIALTGAIFFTPSQANAANAADFDPGYIIDDYVFYNSNAMDANQIQNFLLSKNPNCDYWGTQSAADWGYPNLTHAQIAEYKRNGTNGFSRDSTFHAPPYKCLTMYTQDTPYMGAASGYCSAINAGHRNAAQIINDVSKACGINPQVLIILLEKEQSLVTDKWPLDRQLRNATGFACPDTAPCDPAYAGFFYQVYNAARQFKVYQAFPNSYNYRAGRTNNIYWHPDLSRCGSSSVYIQNQATAALYIYTPYRPNQAALNNLYGTGDSCSSYGNRNFWRVFTDWFGSTKAAYTPFDTPRWMVLTRNQIRMAPGTNAAFPDPGNNVLPAGTQLKFTSKIWADNQWYYRTEYNSNIGANVAIPASSVGELSHVPFDTPRWMTLTQDTQKFLSTSDWAFGPTHLTGQNIKFVDKIYVNNQWYFRTELDASLNNGYGIPASRIAEASYVNFDTPRWMQIQTTTNKVNPVFGGTSQQVTAGTQLRFNRKIAIADKIYFQVESDNGTNFGIDSANIREIQYSNLPTANKWLELTETTGKFDPMSGEEHPIKFPAGTQINFSQRIVVNGKVFYRTAFDSQANTNLAVPEDMLKEIEWITLDTPRTMELAVATAKTYPTTGDKYPLTHPVGQQIKFTTKILVNGVWYLRTEFDTQNNTSLGIPQSMLREVSVVN